VGENLSRGFVEADVAFVMSSRLKPSLLRVVCTKYNGSTPHLRSTSILVDVRAIGCLSKSFDVPIMAVVEFSFNAEGIASHPPMSF
jgi:hypothetical protein